MSDKSNWKNKNRNILKGAIEGVTAVTEPFKSTVKGSIEGVTAVTEPFKSTVKGAIEGVKKIAKPFIKESIYIDKIIKSKKKKKKKD